jgi:hypothetical protein
MVKKKSERAYANLRMLEFVARKLGVLNNEVVYLGGCATALFISDPLSLDVRPTRDVDCIVDIISLPEYYQFVERLKGQGFTESIDEQVICRWYYDDAILDIMPINEKILGFGNQWYKEAVKKPNTHQLGDNLIIKSVTAPYLLATKIEAFKARGNNDFLGSHDFEDIITVIAGRAEIADEVALEGNSLKRYLKGFFEEIVNDNNFQTALPGHVYDGPVTFQRVQTVIDRVTAIIAN